MPPWLAIWVARFVSGERLRPGERADYKYWFGALFLFPAEVALFVLLCFPVLKHSGIIVWLLLAAFGVLSLVLALLWARYVPATVSLTLAVVAWSCAFWAAWHYL